jgi:SEC-C motif-containing protein
MKKCYCNSDKGFENCCEPFLKSVMIPENPEQLMRSRYSAYAIHNANYLIKTTHSLERKHYSKTEILEWSKSNTWIKLEVIKAYENIVEFKAFYLDHKLLAKVHHEKSTFKQENNIWYYVDGEFFE